MQVERKHNQETLSGAAGEGKTESGLTVKMTHLNTEIPLNKYSVL